MNRTACPSDGEHTYLHPYYYYYVKHTRTEKVNQDFAYTCAGFEQREREMNE
eukprot:m.107800 g.107800  ORF g.107800 m.107800 type:complete len:52 (-) comp15851_c1_seq2:493-648(-)